MATELPATYNLRLRQGSAYQRRWTPRDADGDPFYDLTGYTARAHIRRDIDSPTTLIEATTANGKIVLGGAAGTILLDLDATDTNIDWGQAVWDLELLPGGVEADAFCLLVGTVEIARQVTR